MCTCRGACAPARARSGLRWRKSRRAPCVEIGPGTKKVAVRAAHDTGATLRAYAATGRKTRELQDLGSERARNDLRLDDTRRWVVDLSVIQRKRRCLVCCTVFQHTNEGGA